MPTAAQWGGCSRGCPVGSSWDSRTGLPAVVALVEAAAQAPDGMALALGRGMDWLLTWEEGVWRKDRRLADELSLRWWALHAAHEAVELVRRGATP